MSRMLRYLATPAYLPSDHGASAKSVMLLCNLFAKIHFSRDLGLSGNEHTLGLIRKERLGRYTSGRFSQTYC